MSSTLSEVEVLGTRSSDLGVLGTMFIWIKFLAKSQIGYLCEFLISWNYRVVAKTR